MASEVQQEGANQPPDGIALESSTYEIIRSRLDGQAAELRQRVNQLNDERKNVFGSIETTLLGTERVTTSNNCIPRDLVSIGDSFLFAYNVHFGLKSERHLSDVFAVYKFEGGAFHEQPLDLLADPQFERELLDVFRYYKNATFSHFDLKPPFVYMVFQVGKTATDVKTFKWQIDGESLKYVDNRSDHEARYPSQHEFEWQRTTRDQHEQGVHPHISIDDRVFVEAVGGDLTIKIENNTDSGEGIYSEPVAERDQTLDDAEIYYAIIDNLVLLKIKPYQEDTWRYIVYCEKTREAQRVDGIGESCVLLPDSQGLIFSNGYYLQTGEYKTFDHGIEDLSFARRLTAPNGEDHLYVFHNRECGTYVLLKYNLISQSVDTPLVCHGFTLFPGGELVCFKSQEEAQRHHALQIWKTPFLGEDQPTEAKTDSYLYKVGNRDIVRGMAECRVILTLIAKEDTYADLYVDLVREAGDIVDSYFWISSPEAFAPGETLEQIRQTASAAVGEFEKVTRVRQSTVRQTKDVTERCQELTAAVHRLRYDNIFDFVKALSDLRGLRGEIISLRELRYVDLTLVEKSEKKVVEEAERLSNRCVEFLLKPEALGAYQERISTADAQIDKLEKVTEAREVEEDFAECARELEMLIEIVSNLKIEDTTQRTEIIDNISALFGTLNSSRASLKQHSQKLLQTEGQAEFHSQLKLLNQSVVNFLDVANSPEKCDEYLTKLMVQVEELEGRFAEFDEFIIELAEKREELYNAFESRKQSLMEARAKRADSLKNAADRILKGISNRVNQLEEINDINAYFASDLMVDKVRDILKQLEELDDSVKVDDIQSQLKSIREDSVRQLKDRQDLFVDGQQVIRLGEYKFSVNIQPLELTTVVRDDQMMLHLSGTNFYEVLDDPKLNKTRGVWKQEVVSENRQVYRAEYLSHVMLSETVSQLDSADTLHRWAVSPLDELQAEISRFMSPRYEESYSKGVHDHDAARLLQALTRLHTGIGLLRYRPEDRSAARLFWEYFCPEPVKKRLAAQASSFGSVTRMFPETAEASDYVTEITSLIDEHLNEHVLFASDRTTMAAGYLFDQLQIDQRFAVSQTSARLFDDFQLQLGSTEFAGDFRAMNKALTRSPADRYRTLRDWASAFIRKRSKPDEIKYVDELASLLMAGEVDHGQIVSAETTVVLEQMLGTHPRIADGQCELDFHEFQTRIAAFENETIPRFRQFGELKKTILEETREDMRLDEFQPKVLTSFVRNQLLDKVYLPLIGANLSKQIGTAGDTTRTDRMGLLLLVSPPGYGKTTLMEYIANRLGLIFMKINGPAIGHDVTSLDPQSAPNASAREEVEKLNLAFEMGDNVMIYLDDIQHCNPEFLQKFISLCDAQRRIEGVYKGRPQTYDFRGRKVAVVMAGNPYTESGEKFQIPDMLSNRADVYNLGEMVGEHQGAFENSYIENCLTSNPVLNKLATRSQDDVYRILKMAEGKADGTPDLDGNYSAEELQEMVTVFQKLMRVRDVVLAVNREYIRSAAQSDDYRTEPPFKLQGSYRNMNRIAEKVVSVMNDEELEELILASYENDSQTLTSDTEANMLKFRELTGTLGESDQARWDAIRNTFQRNNRLRGLGSDDKTAQILVELGQFNDNLSNVGEAVSSGFEALAMDRPEQDELETDRVEQPPLLTPDMLESMRGFSLNLHQSLQRIHEEIGRLSETGIVAQISDDNKDDDADKTPPTPESIPAPQTANLNDVLRAAAGGSQGEPGRITVVNKLPRSFLNVVEQQFELMSRWMKPLLESTQQQTGEMVELKDGLKDCLKQYRRLLRRLEDAGD